MRSVAVALWLAAGLASPSFAGGLPEVRVVNPATFGYQVGDVVQRDLLISLPDGDRFDTASIPAPTRHGAALELSDVQHEGADDAHEQRLRLRYQIFRSPETPAVLDMPAILLRFTVPQGTGRREMTVRVEAHPLMVSPLAPAQPPNRVGLGPMQPDLPAPLLPLAPLRQRAAALAALALLASLWLGWRHAGRAWWQRRHRPFASAARDIRGLLRSTDEAALDAAVRRLHSALNEDAGRVMLAADLPAWLAERPRYRVLEPALQQFHAHSSLRFFASTPRSAADVAAETQAIATLSQALARLERTP